MIPYTVDRRPDTGVNNVTLGVWLFLASEVMLFGALFSAYALLRATASTWPDARAHLSLGLGVTHTALLVAATTCAWRARGAAARVRWLTASVLVASVFIGAKGLEYSAEFGRGLRPADNTFLATYFTFTALHALHVIGGIGGNLWAMAGTRHVPEAQTIGRIRALGLYWTFVDIIWLFIFVSFYLA